jgi:hypothetical protein
MSRVVVLAFVATAAAVSLAPKALAQPGTPGQINDPSTYRGSMANQAAEQQASQAQEAANPQMLQRMDQNYAAYAPGARRSGGGGGGGPPPLKSHPLLPAAKNPLLGMWRMGKTKSMDLTNIPLLFPGTQEIVDGALGGGCASVLGKPDTVIRFTPTQLNWVAPDGHDEVLNHVEYRSDGANIIVIASDGDLPLIFGMPNKDHAVVALFGCTMSRTNTAARLGQTATAGSGGGPAAGAGAAGVGQAILNLTVGQTVNGTFSSPPAGTRLFLTNQNPEVSLARAGFTPAPGAQPIEALFDACRLNQTGTQAKCNQAMAALTTGAVGATETDANGRAATGALPPGRYYVVGFTPYQGHSLIWHLPVDLKPGANTVALTPQNGSISH